MKDLSRGVVRVVVAGAIFSFVAVTGCVGTRLPSDAAHEPEPEPATAASDWDREQELLRSLGYLEWVELDSGAADVTHYQPERSFAGLNLYADLIERRAHIMDMHGEVVHTWNAPRPRGVKRDRPWTYVEARPDGDLLAIQKHTSLDKLSWNSELRWSLPLRAHHDLDIDDAGNLYVLVKRQHEVMIAGESLTIAEDGVAIVSPDGTVKHEIWLFEPLAELLSEEQIAEARQAQWALDLPPAPTGETPLKVRLARKQTDLFHANTIEILDRDVPELGRAGMVLLSLRNVDALVVVDLENRSLEWSWGRDVLDGPHQPRVLENGNLLVFDNGFLRRKWSRVIEIVPATGEIVWSHPPDPAALGADHFHSVNRSGCQVLPNGNVLVTVARSGRVFEVTREHEILWDWSNPRIEGDTRATVNRMERLPLEYFDRMLPAVANP